MTVVSDLLRAEGDQPSGYRHYTAYPGHLQATDFPKLGPGVRLTGNNQAFFFVKAEKRSDGSLEILPNTEALERLFTNMIQAVRGDFPNQIVRLQIDSSVILASDQFVQSYQNLRSEADEQDRERLLGRECQLIGEFLKADGFLSVAKKVIAQNAAQRGQALSADAIDARAEKFLHNHFRFEGVHVDKPLPYATWEVVTPYGTLMARQEYIPATQNTQRSWKVGVAPQVEALAKNGHVGAQEVWDAVVYTGGRPTIDLIAMFTPEDPGKRPRTGLDRSGPPV